MKHSPLQLLKYFVTDVSVSANQSFDPTKPAEAAPDQFSVEIVVNRTEPPKDFPAHTWGIQMDMSQNLADGKNVPYSHKLICMGLFACKEAPKNTDEERFVRINGSSVLYGCARETIRSLTAAGPWGEITLPTVSFYEDNSNHKEESAAVPKTE